MGRTRISGQLLIRDAILEDRGGEANDRGYGRSSARGCALNAPRLTVGAEVTLEGRCEVAGSVDLSMSELSGMTVGGQCVLRAPGRSALKLTNAELRGDLRLDGGVSVAGTVRLAGAVIHGALELHGFLSGPERRSVVGATALVVAQRRGARQVGRSSRARLRRALDIFYGVTIGYGYRPWRVLWALTVLLVLVAVSLAIPASQATLRATNGNGDVYTTQGLLRTTAGPASGDAGATGGAAGADSCGDGGVRCFSPVLYAIDTVIPLIPLISLEQRSTWYPDPHVRDGTLTLWWLNIATLLGWLLSSIFALSFARLARSA
jgi:hypothetical protein